MAVGLGGIVPVRRHAIESVPPRVHPVLRRLEHCIKPIFGPVEVATTTPMIEVPPATTDEMILVFLRAEIDFPTDRGKWFAGALVCHSAIEGEAATKALTSAVVASIR